MADSGSNNEIITDSVLISVALDRAHHKHALLTLVLPGSNKHYLSVIVDIDYQANVLYIDLLKPEHGDLQLARSKKFSVYTKNQGIFISFESHFLRTVGKQEQKTHCIQYPTQIRYLDHRDSHRIPVGRGLNVSVEFPQQQSASIVMRVADISMHGIGLITRYSVMQSLRAQNQTVFDCVIHFPDNIDWPCQLEFCQQHQYREDESYLHVGSRFVNTTLKQRNTLSKQLRLLERENVRRRTSEEY